MSLLFLGKLLEIFITSFTILVITMLLQYGKIKYIKDLRAVFIGYFVLIVLSIFPAFNSIPIVSDLVKYLLLVLISFLLYRIFLDEESKGRRKELHILLVTVFVLTPIISLGLGESHLLEGIGFIYLGVSFIVTGIVWLKLVLTHLSASKIVGGTFILFGLHLLDFIVFQYDEFMFLIGYIVAGGFIILITYGLILLNFAHLKELDEVMYSQYTGLFNNSTDAIFLIENQTIIECNEKAEDLFKYSKNDIVGKTPMSLSLESQKNGRRADDYASELFASSAEGMVTLFDWIHLDSQGQEIYCEVSLFAIDTNKFAAMIRDMTSKYMYEEKLNFHKYYDPLTHLPMRDLFIDRLSRDLEDNPYHVALIAFNIDDFKQINDQYGHEVGDDLLKKVAEGVLKVFSNEITLTRLGGDEFVAIIKNLKYNDLIYIPIEKIQKVFESPFELEQDQLSVTACFGVAFSEGRDTQAMDLLKNVDLALNIAKGKGKEKLEFYSQKEKEIFIERVTLEKEMKLGIEAGEFIPYYQPIVDAQTGEIVGAEVLARWRKEDGTMIYPDVFIPVAEETQLIKEMGSSILSQACKDCKGIFESHKDFFIHVNLSPLQLQNKDIVKELKDLMERWEITARHLVIELTETVFIEDQSRTNEILRKIRNMGIGVALDDFGTGYSSLSYLMEMQIDTIKIDRSFIVKLPHNKKAKAMVNYLIKLAHDLDYSIVVEGVEEKDQADYIASLGCEYIQGYHYYRPMPFDHMSKLMMAKE